MDEFISRRLGPELAEYAISSLVRGICAGDSKQVSVHFIAKYLHQLEQETGRIGSGWSETGSEDGSSSPRPNPRLYLQ